jgi:hypothetical protein
MNVPRKCGVTSGSSILAGILSAALLASPAAAATCGNAIIEAGEDCDDGSTNNGTPNSCCTSSCTFTGKSPDVIVGDLVGTTRWGATGGITAFSVGTTSCNLGSCWLNWISGTAEHPVIGQNLFRLKDGRFEQIGQSWLKHGFQALHGNVCSDSCIVPPDGSHLGVNCSDPYSTMLNGDQTRLGPKENVNPSTGVFLYPDPRENTTGNSIFKRLQVHTTDLDPALNAGAVYFVEGQYVCHDDATAKNNANNASYRPVNVTGSAGTFSIGLTGTTVRGQAGIQAWKATDATVTESIFDTVGGEFIVSAKATSLGGGLYHYEYAVQNLTNERAGQAFTVPIPPGTVVTNVGFHDVDYHSGEVFDGTDWASTVTASSVSWATAPYAVNVNANALRWGTLYNFRFDANQAPGTAAVVIDLFKPGTPGSVSLSTVTPVTCGGAPNGTACSDGNACSVADACASGSCVAGSPVVCSASDACHLPGACAPATGVCSNPVAPDGTGCNDGNACTQTDVCVSGVCGGTNPVSCSAVDVCHDVGTCSPATGICSNPAKADGTPCDDGSDCTVNDACNGGVCAGTGQPAPGEVDNAVTLSQNQGVSTITWHQAPGSTSSDVLRGLVSGLPVGPGGADEVCLDSGDLGTSTTDTAEPDPGEAFWYLVHGSNSCGDGPYGAQVQDGVPSPRVSATCP